MNFGLMTSIFLFHDKNTSINDKSIISEKVYFCNVNFTRRLRRQIHQSLSKNRLNLSLIYDAEHSVILTELQSALRLSPIHPTNPNRSLGLVVFRSFRRMNFVCLLMSDSEPLLIKNKRKASYNSRKTATKHYAHSFYQELGR